MGGSGLLLAPSSSAAVECTSSGGCVAVHEYVAGNDSVVDQFTADQLAGDADVSPDGGSTCYDVRFTGEQNGDAQSDCVSNGLSINGLLQASNIDVNTVTFVAIPRDNGTWSILTNQQLQDPVSSQVFVDGLLPVVYSFGDNVRYIRPLTSPNAANNNDVFTPVNANTALDVYVFSGPMLTVTATSSAVKRRVPVGVPVHFSATATDNGAAPADSVNYSWKFGNDGAADTQTATHSFQTPGQYLILVTATGAADGSGGMAKPLLLTVGAKGKPSPTQSPTPPPQQTSTKTPAPLPSPSDSPTARSSRHAGRGAAAGPTPSFGSFAGLGGDLPKLQPLGSGGRPAVAPNASGLPVVSGQLIDGGSVALSASSLASDASTVESSPTVDTARWSPGTVPIYVAVVLLLLGAGIARERGWLTLRRR